MRIMMKTFLACVIIHFVVNVHDALASVDLTIRDYGVSMGHDGKILKMKPGGTRGMQVLSREEGILIQWLFPISLKV